MTSKAKMVRSEIETAVAKIILSIAKENSLLVDEVVQDQQLVSDLGFRSIDQMNLISRLEDIFKIDPFYESEISLTETSTVEEVCDIYENYLNADAVN